VVEIYRREVQVERGKENDKVELPPDLMRQQVALWRIYQMAFEKAYEIEAAQAEGAAQGQERAMKEEEGGRDTRAVA
jgi:hypothetical protein